MKRHGQLMPAIATFDNVVAAFHLAAAGKRQTRAVREFAAEFDAGINRLVGELITGAWQPGEYERFTVRDPKLRVIHAAPFRDRVAHHALMRVAGPLLERGALPHSHACRAGKGNLAAVQHAARCTRRHRFFLKLDIRRYFDSIAHGTLAALLRRRFKDGVLLGVLQRLIASFSTTPGRGLPIGTLTSQYLANFYLDGLDRRVVETLRAPGYVRYMDDFILWHDDATQLAAWREDIQRWLAAERGLEIKHLARPLPSSGGVAFLGYRITPRAVLLGRRARRRFRFRLRALEREHDEGRLKSAALQRRADALLAFTEAAACHAWRRALLHPTEPSSEPQAPTAWCAAAPGTTRPGTAAPPSATGTTRATGTGTSACACPQLTRAADAARLTRSLKSDGSAVRDSRSPGAGRDASRHQPNASGDSFFPAP